MSYLSRILLVVTLFASYVATSKQPPANNLDALPQRATVHFPISCTSEAGELFDRAIVRLHSFSNEQAEKEFRAVSEKDPACAMAYWGVAMSLWNELADYPDTATIQKANQAILKARELKPKTGREGDYVEAIELFYRNAESIDGHTRAVTYSNAMAKFTRNTRKTTKAPRSMPCRYWPQNRTTTQRSQIG